MELDLDGAGLYHIFARSSILYILVIIFRSSCQQLANRLNLIYRLSFFTLNRMGSVRANVEEHRDILDVVKAGDGRAAERHIQHHITHFRTMVERLL